MFTGNRDIIKPNIVYKNSFVLTCSSFAGNQNARCVLKEFKMPVVAFRPKEINFSRRFYFSLGLILLINVLKELVHSTSVQIKSRPNSFFLTFNLNIAS